jgi:uncharacterized protein YukE
MGYSTVSGGSVVVSGEAFQVDVAALACSAAHVGGQGDDVAIAHLSSHNRMEAAQSGWVGASAEALTAKMARWSATSRTLLTHVGDHSLRLSNDTIGFAALERVNAAKSDAVCDSSDGVAAMAWG